EDGIRDKLVTGVQTCALPIWVPRRDRVMRKLRDEFLNRRLGIEADLDRIRADECAAEDAARQAGNVVALERFENAHRDLGGRGRSEERRVGKECREGRSRASE